MSRQKNDGRGRLGGRQAGTPNKDKPLKVFLREHSMDYYLPCIEEVVGGVATGRLLSRFDMDMLLLSPAERVDAELKLLRFHTPQMQSTSVDMTVVQQDMTLGERLSLLVEGKEIVDGDG